LDLKLVDFTYLYVPGNKLDFIEKGLQKGAEKIIIDLEDSIPLHLKKETLMNVSNFLKHSPSTDCFVRLNSEKKLQEDELIELSKIGHKNILIPKIEFDSFIVNSELKSNFEQIIILVETATGLFNLENISKLLPFNRIAIGEVDFSADLGIDENNENLEFYRSKIVFMSKVLGLPKPIGGVFKNFNDTEGLIEFARNLKSMGFGALQLIHPNQIIEVKNIFYPTIEEITNAKNLLKNLVDNQKNGIGVYVDENGNIVDAAMIKKAKELANFNENR
jgi:citrate lyase beta subunit